MEKFSFQVSVETRDNTGEVMAVYFRIRKGRSVLTREYANGNLFADYNKKGELLGMELLAPCKASVLNKIALQPEAKQFINKAIPKGMLATC